MLGFEAAMRPHIELVWLLFFVFLCAYMVWTWIAHLRSPDRMSRIWKAIAGVCCATVSMGLAEFLYIHAVFTGGYRFYHPVELFCIRIGLLTALLGIASAIIGRGKARFHLMVVSLLNLLLWLMDAVAQ
jgi:hypothetical protein